MFKFGQEVKDKITGFKGIVIGHCSYINGCEQYLVQPKSRKSDSKPDGHWLDVDRLIIVGNKIIYIKEKKHDGCDLSAPTK